MKNTNFTKFASIIILITICFAACDNSSEVRLVYSPAEFMEVTNKYPNAQIKIIDSQCIKESYNALKDVRNDSLVFFCDSFDYAFSEKKTTFKKYGIKVKHYQGTDFGRVEGFEQGCYYSIMMSFVQNKLGENRIDSLIFESEKRFAFKNQDCVFIRDGEDVRKLYLK